VASIDENEHVRALAHLIRPWPESLKESFSGNSLDFTLEETSPTFAVTLSKLKEMRKILIFSLDIVMTSQISMWPRDLMYLNSSVAQSILPEPIDDIVKKQSLFMTIKKGHEILSKEERMKPYDKNNEETYLEDDSNPLLRRKSNPRPSLSTERRNGKTFNKIRAEWDWIDCHWQEISTRYPN
jgi:hypothetical protein